MRTAGIATPPRLPYHTPLLSDEALISWIWRLAGRFEISARHFLQGAFGIRPIDKQSVRHGTWWRTPEQSFVAGISRRTGIADARLWEATLANWSPASPGGEEGWGPAGRKFMGGAMARVSELIAVCPQCLAEDIVYARTSWFFQWLSCCPKHGTIMVCACASCGTRISTPPLSVVGPWQLGRCRACGSSIVGAKTAQAHDKVRALQRRFLDGKRTGWIALPGLEPMAWPPFVEGINAIAEVIWVHGKPACRRDLFALIAKDVGVDALKPEEPPRKIGHGRARHDAMLVIAWILARWPKRLMIAADIFGVTRRRWRICSRPKPVRDALQALPWALARDVLWRTEGWPDSSRDTRSDPAFLDSACRLLLARRPRLARQARWLTRLHGKDIWRQRLLSLLEWEPHLWSVDSGDEDEEFYDLPHKIYPSTSNSTN
jgi:TniQ protein